MAGNFEVGHVLLRPGGNLIGSKLRTLFENDEGSTHLTHALIGDADHCDLRDALHLEEQAFDLGRIAVETTHDEHVLDAICNAQIPAVVHHSNIAGMQPAIAINRFARRIVIIEVAAHQVVTAHHHLTRLPPLDLLAVPVDALHFDAVDGAT